MNFARDLQTYLKSKGVAGSWADFRAELGRRAQAAGVAAHELTITHPLFTQLLDERRGPFPGVDITRNYHR